MNLLRYEFVDGSDNSINGMLPGHGLATSGRPLRKKVGVNASQLPIAKWHEYIAEPTLANAIMDRLMANAHRFELKGESLRKKSVKNPSEKN